MNKKMYLMLIATADLGRYERINMNVKARIISSPFIVINTGTSTLEMTESGNFELYLEEIKIGPFYFIDKMEIL